MMGSHQKIELQGQQLVASGNSRGKWWKWLGLRGGRWQWERSNRNEEVRLALMRLDSLDGSRKEQSGTLVGFMALAT